MINTSHSCSLVCCAHFVSIRFRPIPIHLMSSFLIQKKRETSCWCLVSLRHTQQTQHLIWNLWKFAETAVIVVFIRSRREDFYSYMELRIANVGLFYLIRVVMEISIAPSRWHFIVNSLENWFTMFFSLTVQYSSSICIANRSLS